MKTDKELLKDFRERFHPQMMLHESQVLVLMGMARQEERRRTKGSELKAKKTDVCLSCGHQNSENCNTCSDLEKHGYSFETGT